MNVGASEHEELEFGADHGGVADAVPERRHHHPFVPKGVVTLHLWIEAALSSGGTAEGGVACSGVLTCFREMDGDAGKTPAMAV